MSTASQGPESRPPSITGSTARETGSGSSPASAPRRSRGWGCPRQAHGRAGRLSDRANRGDRGAVVVAVSFVFPGSQRSRPGAPPRFGGGTPPARSTTLDRSRSLNPLSSRSDLLAGAIASRTNAVRRMARRSKRPSIGRPQDWYAHLELAMAYAALEQRKRAGRAWGFDGSTARGSDRRGEGRVAAGRPVDRARSTGCSSTESGRESDLNPNGGFLPSGYVESQKSVGNVDQPHRGNYPHGELLIAAD